MDMSDRIGPGIRPPVASLSTVTDSVTGAPPRTGKELRTALVDQLRDAGTVRSPRIEQAMRTVHRHRFVPDVSAEEAYADKPLYTKHDDVGVSISAASQPTIVAMMLEQLQVEHGHAVLEIGTGTGYNAALLARLTGTAGHVTTIDVDREVVEDARAALATADCAHVHTVHGDGVFGYSDGAPYDRIVATVGAHGVPPAWLDQLAPGGRLVVPLRLRGSVSRSIVFERDSTGRWCSVGSEMCTFMPLRGIAADARHTISLAPDKMVRLETYRDQVVDPGALADVLRQRRVTAWTEVTFGGMESMEWLYLWLACTLPNAISRMPVEQAAVDHGLVDPQFGWGAMATFDQRNLAYLTARKHEPTPEHEPWYELGLVGHGPCGDDLVDRMLDTIRSWDRYYRSNSVDFEIEPTLSDSATSIRVDSAIPPQRPIIRFAVDTPLNQIIVACH